MRIFNLTAVLLTSISLPAMAQGNPAATMKGVVAREDGKAVASAFVLVRDYQQTSQGYVSDTWESRTEVDGSFSLVVEPGCYDLFVSANTQFLPFSRRICIQAERSSVLKINLKADPHPLLRQR
jgi:hypothetical protein